MLFYSALSENMGFFDSLANKAKNAIKDAAKEAINDVNPFAKENANVTEVKRSYENDPDRATELETVNFENVFVPGSREIVANSCEAINDDIIDVKYTFLMSPEFRKSESGACEIEEIYVYAPNVDVDEYVEDELDMPCVYYGFEQNFYDIVEDYLEKRKIKPNKKLYQVTGSRAVYLTEIYDEICKKKRIAYHMYKHKTNELYSQFCADIPSEYFGTSVEKNTMDCLKQLVSTFALKEE